MNRGESILGAILGAFGTIVVSWVILYSIVFENVLVVAEQIGYDLYPVESQLWWLFVGCILLTGIRAVTKIQKYLRRNNCPHCGDELPQ